MNECKVILEKYKSLNYMKIDWKDLDFLHYYKVAM